MALSFIYLDRNGCPFTIFEYRLAYRISLPLIGYMLLCMPGRSEAKRCITSCIDEYAIPSCTHIERHRGMRIAGVHLRIRVNAKSLLLSALVEREHLQSQPVDILTRLKRQPNRSAAAIDECRWLQ